MGWAVSVPLPGLVSAWIDFHKTYLFLPVIHFNTDLQIHNAWAGYYEYNTFDQNGIIGPHPVISNFIFANGFSGHGIQQSPAVGQAISEIILDGRSHSIELQDFTFERILEGKPIVEKNII